MKKEERELRIALVKMAGGLALSEIPFALRFIKGDGKALEELEDFRKWREERDLNRVLQGA